tara:strand:+ start:1203 stop:1499 length:297 start_codon:yes stop_codon:yes gene_type:complete
MKDLINLRNHIEKMNIIHHIKIFEILSKKGIEFSENRNGIFFNMNKFDSSVIEEINVYINYVNEQEDKLNETEKLKEDFHNEFFKDNKDKNEKILYTS